MNPHKSVDCILALVDQHIGYNRLVTCVEWDEFDRGFVPLNGQYLVVRCKLDRPNGTSVFHAEGDVLGIVCALDHDSRRTTGTNGEYLKNM